MEAADIPTTRAGLRWMAACAPRRYFGNLIPVACSTSDDELTYVTQTLYFYHGVPMSRHFDMSIVFGHFRLD